MRLAQCVEGSEDLEERLPGCAVPNCCAVEKCRMLGVLGPGPWPHLLLEKPRLSLLQEVHPLPAEQSNMLNSIVQERWMAAEWRFFVLVF